MACLCGDICCSSCGPAQGNYRCVLCHEWASEGCEHLDPEQGDHAYKPEFRAQVEQKFRELEEADARAVAAELEAERAAEEYYRAYNAQELPDDGT